MLQTLCAEVIGVEVALFRVTVNNLGKYQWENAQEKLDCQSEDGHDSMLEGAAVFLLFALGRSNSRSW